MSPISFSILVIPWLTITALANVSKEQETSSSPIVQTKYGPIRGVSLNGHYEFRGIPFAKPPVGPLRFKV